MNSMKRARLVVLISGGGTNLQAVLDACAADRLAADVVAVFSNKRRAFGLARAERAGVATVYVPKKAFMRQGHSRDDYDADVARQVAEYRPDIVVLAGWMHVLSPSFLGLFPRRVINLHPALPGEFAGTHAIERAYEAWRSGTIERSGVMVHEVIPEVDAGAPIAVAEVPFEPDDTLDSFESRVHATEHKLLVHAIAAHWRALQSLQVTAADSAASNVKQGP